MATIVWLPVPTAMVGQMETDAPQEVLYIGTLILTQVTSLAARVHLLRHPELTTASAARIRHGAAADLAAIALFGAALAIAVAVGTQGYLALLLLAFTGPLAALIDRMLSRRADRGPDRPSAPEGHG